MKKIGFREAKMLWNIFMNLKHNKEYTRYQIAKASGNYRHFYRIKMLEMLVEEGIFINMSETFKFKRDRLWEFMQEREIFQEMRRIVKTFENLPLVW